MEVRATLPHLAPFARDDEDDLVQECCIHWDSRRRSYKPELASPRTFLKRVTANKLRDLQRREIGRRDRTALSLARVSREDQQPLADQLADAAPTPDVMAERAELEARIRKTYSRLPAGDLAVAQGYADGLTPTEISRKLGISRQSVHRARARIRKVFIADGLEEFLP